MLFILLELVSLMLQICIEIASQASNAMYKHTNLGYLQRWAGTQMTWVNCGWSPSSFLVTLAVPRWWQAIFWNLNDEPGGTFTVHRQCRVHQPTIQKIKYIGRTKENFNLDDGWSYSMNCFVSITRTFWKYCNQKTENYLLATKCRYWRGN